MSAQCFYISILLLVTPPPDPAYQQRVPSLDGGEGSSEHILFGTNVDWKEERHRESE